MKERYKQKIRIIRVLMGPVEHTVKVTKINRNYHCRVFVNGELNQEAICYSKLDIGFTCRSLLRWEDKCGNVSKYAASARKRHNRKDFIYYGPK